LTNKSSSWSMARLLDARASWGAFSRERMLASSSYLARLARSIEISFAFASWGFCFGVHEFGS
jgi:hypothetical protein